MINASPKVSTLGENIDAKPTTNKILKMLLPIILPIAISDFFLSEAAMQVISSGSDVPNATTVSEIVLSSTPITCAMLFADDTHKSDKSYQYQYGQLVLFGKLWHFICRAVVTLLVKVEQIA